MPNKRQALSKPIETDVLLASRRRCCLCVFLDHRKGRRRGQIAHLNHNPSDSRFENLVFLCLEHHDEYDATSRLSKSFTTAEVKTYRDRLYAENQMLKIPRLMHSAEHTDSQRNNSKDLSIFELTLNRHQEQFDYLSRAWRFPLWQVANLPELFAYKAGNRADGICLIERINLPDGRIVIVCIEVAGTPGNSITNCVEELCFQVCKRFEIPPHLLVWLEHYDVYEGAEWNMVTFARRPPGHMFEEPTWTTMTQKMWQNLHLKPKKKLRIRNGHYGSKVTKLFYWPTEAIL